MKREKNVTVAALLVVAPVLSFGAIIVNDSFADGDRANTGPLQAAWYGSSTSGAIESNVGSVGLVSGSSGRQIHAMFPTQTLANNGDWLKATVTFTTPATIDSDNNGGEDLKIGLFDYLDRNNASQLGQDTSYSSSSPNTDYNGLPGYNVEIDVEPSDPATDLQLRRSDPSTTGRLLSTNTGLSSMGSGPDIGYVIAPNTSYTVDLLIARGAGGELDITTTFLGNSHTETDDSPLSYDFGMLGMGSSSRAFGSSNTAGEADNGIDITNFTLEVIPEPASLGLMGMASVVFLFIRRRMKR